MSDPCPVCYALVVSDMTSAIGIDSMNVHLAWHGRRGEHNPGCVFQGWTPTLTRQAPPCPCPSANAGVVDL